MTSRTSEHASLPTEANKLVALVHGLLGRVEALEADVTVLRAENVELKADNIRLRADNAALKTDTAELKADNARLRRENAWLRKQLFGPTRERVDRARLHEAWARFQADEQGTSAAADPGTAPAFQLLLGLSTPTSMESSKGELPPTIPTPPPPPPRNNRHLHGRAPLPAHLPVERIVFEPANVPEGARRIGEEISERLGYRKASFVRVLIVRPKYAAAEPHGETRIDVAPIPDEMVPRGLCDPAMLARLVMAKWGDHVPWHRLAGIFAREGVPLAASTMAGAARRAEPLARCLVDAMWAEARREAKVLAIDATTAKVQAKGKCARAYPWVVVADRSAVLFGFSTSHTQDVPERLLAGFGGYVLADASSVYDPLFERDDGPSECGCFAHARRKFFYAVPCDERALVGVRFADELFAIERDLKPLTATDREAQRGLRSRPVVDAFARWRDGLLANADLDPKGPLLNALRYSLRHWEALTRFLDDGDIPLSNNFTELQIRHIAVGRKAWLFFGSEPDAQAACTWLSLIASAKLVGLNAEDYLRDLFRVLPSWPRSRILELAPRRWNATRALLDPTSLAQPLGAVAFAVVADAAE